MKYWLGLLRKHYVENQPQYLGLMTEGKSGIITRRVFQKVNGKKKGKQWRCLYKLVFYKDVKDSSPLCPFTGLTRFIFK